MAEDWMVKARCREMSPALFFPCEGGGVQLAQQICLGCMVRVQCLDFALAQRITHGVWGATSERERVRLARARRARAAGMARRGNEPVLGR
jgi:WhiB family redox-sensing transcriptional regulator